MIPLVLLSVFVLLALLAEAFFSGSEIAFISASRPKLYKKAKENLPNALLAKFLIAKPERLFSTTVVGTNLCINLVTTIVTLFTIHHYGLDKGWMSAVILTPLILIFGEFIPKFVARAKADELVLKLAKPLTFASYLLTPLTKIFGFYADFLRNLLGESSDKSFFLSREEIKAALPTSRGSDVTQAERKLISRILNFNQMTVKETFRPLIEVIAIEQEQSLADAVRLFGESGHSRLPVYEERVDKIVGVIQGFDCLKATDLNQPVRCAMRPPLFVPESKPVDELLSELKIHPMAIVVNEFGGAEGIITMEDVMEEVVGEIEDEYDEPPQLYRKISDNTFIVSARIELDVLSDLIKVPLAADEDYQTLGGFLLKHMQKIPKKWDSTVISGVEYIIQSATDRSIEEVYLIVHQRP
ncbi:MAG: hemolysin family protein [Pseudomonadota bacterium]